MAVVVGVVALESFDKTQAGEVAVIRNGGPLDNNSVRQVLQPASARVLGAIRYARNEQTQRPQLENVRWRTAHASRGGVTQNVVRREVVATGQVLEERVVASVPDDASDYDTRFDEAVSLARARAELRRWGALTPDTQSVSRAAPRRAASRRTAWRRRR